MFSNSFYNFAEVSALNTTVFKDAWKWKCVKQIQKLNKYISLFVNRDNKSASWNDELDLEV